MLITRSVIERYRITRLERVEFRARQSKVRHDLHAIAGRDDHDGIGGVGDGVNHRAVLNAGGERIGDPDFVDDGDGLEEEEGEQESVHVNHKQFLCRGQFLPPSESPAL